MTPTQPKTNIALAVEQQEPQREDYEGTKNALWGRILRKKNSTRIAALFVHGFMGNPTETWKSSSSAMSFAQLIESDVSLPEVDCFFFSYNTSAYRGSSIENIAIRLKQCVDHFVDDLQTSGIKYSIVLISHSMGGLVAMRYIIDCLTQNQPPPLRGLIMYGTPSSGVELIRSAEEAVGILASLIFGIPGVKLAASKLSNYHAQIKDLKVASKFITNLQEQWALRVINGGDAQAGPGRMWLPVHVVVAQGDWVVAKHSARGLYGAISSSSVEGDHIGMVKPDSIKDERYQSCQRFLKLCAKEKGPDTLSQLWRLSDSVWSTRNRDIFYNQIAHVAFFPSAPQIPPELAKMGFAICKVDWRYRVTLAAASLRIGAAFGRLPAEEVWKLQPHPVYVHQILPATLKRETQDDLMKAASSLFAGSQQDSIWSSIFSYTKLTINAVELTDGNFVDQGSIQRNWICKEFPVPAEMRNKEVEFRLEYAGIVPAKLDNFHFFNFAILNGFTGTVEVFGDWDFMIPYVALVPGQKPIVSEGDSTSISRSVRFQLDDVVVPGCSFSARWG